MARTISRSRVCRPDGYGIEAKTEPDGSVWHEGHVRTEHGYVRVYAEGKFASLSIIHDGYNVTQTFRKKYSRRALVTLAARFAKEVCNG